MARHCSAACRQQLTMSAVLALDGWTRTQSQGCKLLEDTTPNDLNSSLQHGAALPHMFTFTQVFIGKKLEKGAETKVWIDFFFLFFFLPTLGLQFVKEAKLSLEKI